MPNNGKDYTRSKAPNSKTTSNLSGTVQEVFSRRIKEERNKQGFTQQELADCAQVSLDTIKRYESGCKGMRLDVAFDIANALDIPLQYLLPSKGNDAERILHEVKALIPDLLELVKNQ